MSFDYCSGAYSVFTYETHRFICTCNHIYFVSLAEFCHNNMFKQKQKNPHKNQKTNKKPKRSVKELKLENKQKNKQPVFYSLLQ